MATDEGILTDEQLLNLCRVSRSDEEISTEWMADLRAVSLIIGARRVQQGSRLEHAVSLLTATLASRPQYNPTHLPFGFEGPRVQSRGWIERDRLEQVAKQLVGLQWSDVDPTAIAMEVQRAVTGAITFGFIEEQDYDAWQPGMASGTGWRSALRASEYGVVKARAMTRGLATNGFVSHARALSQDTSPTASYSPHMSSRPTARRTRPEDIAFREQGRSKRSEIAEDVEIARVRCDVPALLRSLIAEIVLWTRELKSETFLLFDDTEEGRSNRQMMRSVPSGISITPAYATLGFMVAPDAHDLVELAVGESQAQALAKRLDQFDKLRGEFGDAVARLASTWDDNPEMELEALLVIDERRANLKHAAFDLCRYLETLAHLATTRNGNPQSATAPSGDTHRSATGVNADMNRLNDMERNCIQAMGERNIVGPNAGNRPSQETLAKWAGYSCDTTFKTALSSLVKADYLDNGRHHGKRGGYFLTPKGKLASDHLRSS